MGTATNSEKTHPPLFCPGHRITCPVLDVISCCIDHSCKKFRFLFVNWIRKKFASEVGLFGRKDSYFQEGRIELYKGSLQHWRKLFSIYLDPVWNEFYFFKYVERVSHEGRKKIFACRASLNFELEL